MADESWIYPGRRIPRHSTHKPIYRFASSLMRRQFRCESRLEHDHLLHVERDLRVARFVTQPPTVGYVLNGRFHRYSPDVLIQWEGGQLTIKEVKPVKRLRGHIEKLQAIRGAFFDRGIEFCVVTELEAQAEPITSTLRQIYRHAFHVPPADVRRWLAMAPGGEQLTLREAVASASSLGVNANAPYSAMFYRQVSWCESDPLNEDMTLTIAADK